MPHRTNTKSGPFCKPIGQMPEIDNTITGRLLKEKNMTIGLQFINDIKVLIQGRINGGSLPPLNRPRTYEVEIMPASMPVGRRQSIFARDIDSTRSNLG